MAAASPDFHTANAAPAAVPPRTAGDVVADTHTHLEMLSDPGLGIAQALYHGVCKLCTVIDPSESLESFQQADAWVESARAYLDAWRAAGLQPACEIQQLELRFTLGVHPHNAARYTKEMEQQLIRLAADPRVCAIGEIGLDFHYDLSPRSLQKRVFIRQLQLAKSMGLPVVLHIRTAQREALEILQREGLPPAGCTLHCFNLGADSLRPWLELGCAVSVGGSISFGGSSEARAALGLIPQNRLMSETDAPYMAPQPFRGMECGPAHSIFTVQRMYEELVAQDAFSGDKPSFLRLLAQNADAYFFKRPPSAWQRDAAAVEALAAQAQPCAELLPTIALLTGSPREEAASVHLAWALQRAIHGCNAASDADGGPICRIFELSKHPIEGCNACGACYRSGRCVKTLAGSDDFAQLEALLDSAAALIIVAPLFFAGPSSQFKALLDRCQPYWARRYLLGAGLGSKRPGSIFVIGGGGDPFGYEPLLSICRSAMNNVGFALDDVHDFVGYGQAPLPSANARPNKAARKAAEARDAAFEQQLPDIAAAIVQRALAAPAAPGATPAPAPIPSAEEA